MVETYNTVNEEIIHGTTHSYNKYKCRCELCKKAKNDHRKSSPILNHGTKWYYDKGCRCELCKKAKAEHWVKMNPDFKRRDTTRVQENTRECYVCGIRKSLNDFGADKKRYLGKSYQCKECHNRRGNLNKNKPSQRFTTYRSGAKTRKIDFELSFEQFMELWEKPCYYCGKDINGIGIDRKDPSKGYNVDNIVSCCTQCNRAKTIQTTEDFISMCIKVAKRFENCTVGLNQ